MIRNTMLGAFVMTMLGCASGPTPPELISARSAYFRAQSGVGASLVPADVHDAKKALDAAERAYESDSDSLRTRDLAYVAERRAEFASARAGIAAATLTEQKAKADYQVLQQQAFTSAKGDLSQARQALAETGRELVATGQELSAERKARMEAEKRARDAMDRLAIASALAVKDEPRGTVITIPEGVLFAFGKDQLLPAAQQKLDQVAEALKNQDDRKITVEGHTDAVGTDAYNMDLSQRRAKRVRDYLVSKGVSEKVIDSTGMGKSKPVTDNTTQEGRATNRRVEIIVKPIEQR